MWNKKISCDFPFYPANLIDAGKSYDHWYQYFDKYILEIITQFIKERTKFIDLQCTYGQIFNLLVKYIMDNNASIDIENKEERENYEKQFHMDTYNNIFKVLTINIKLTSLDEVCPLNERASHKTLNLVKILGNIIYSMMRDYKDPIKLGEEDEEYDDADYYH